MALGLEARRETVTDAGGRYRFDDLLPGAYLLEITDPPIYVPTTPLRFTVSVLANAVATPPAVGFSRLPWVLYLPMALRRSAPNGGYPMSRKAIAAISAPILSALFGLTLLVLLGAVLLANSAPAAIMAAPDTRNLIQNGDFEEGLAGWRLDVNTAVASATLTLDTATAAIGHTSARITISRIAPEDYHVTFRQGGLAITPGGSYDLSFWGRSSQPRAIKFVVMPPGRYGERYSDMLIVLLAPEWRRYDLRFLAQGPAEAPLGELDFALSDAGGDLWLDDVQLAPTSLALTPERATLKPDASERFFVKYGAPPYTWSSSHPAVGTLAPSASGDNARFQAHGAGVTLITVIDQTGVTASATVTVIGHSQISVDASQIVLEVPRAAFGNNVGYADQAWHNAITNTTYISAVRDLGVTVLRYPGGIWANFYDSSLNKGWMDWAQPKDACYNLTDGVNTAQFLAFCQAIGCTHAMITANVYANGNPACGQWMTPEDAANWVRQTNISGPFPVRFWELGNEIQAYTDTAHYVPKIQAWSQAMKAVDPTIQIGAVVEAPMLLSQGESINNAPVIAQTADDIDFLIPHPYQDPLPYTAMDEGWRLEVTGMTRATFQRDALTAFEGESSAKISVSATSGDNTAVRLIQADTLIFPTSHYILSFWAKASTNRSLGLIQLHRKADGALLANLAPVNLTTDWQRYALPFSAAYFGGPLEMQAAELSFGLGNIAGDVWLDNVRVLCESPNTQTSQQGDFNGEFGWYLWGFPSIAYQRDMSNYIHGPASLKITLLTPVSDWNQRPLYQKPLAFTAGKHYKLTFWAKSSVPRWTLPWVPHAEYGISAVRLSADWQRFEVPFVATQTDPQAMFGFGIEGPAGDVWFDTISLIDEATGIDLITNGDFDVEFFNDYTARGAFATIQATHPIANLRHLLQLYAPDRAAQIGIQASEWNFLVEHETYPTPTLATDRALSRTLFGAVLETDMLWDMIQEGVSGAQIWYLNGKYSGTLDPEPWLQLYAQYYAMQVNSRRSGELLVSASVTAPTYYLEPVLGGGGINGWSTLADHLSDVPYLSVYPSKSRDGQQLYLIVTNRSPQPENAVVQLQGFLPASTARVWQLTSANWSDMDVVPREYAIQASETFSLTFPARSLTNIALTAAGPPSARPIYLPLVLLGQ